MRSLTPGVTVLAVVVAACASAVAIAAAGTTPQQLSAGASAGAQVDEHAAAGWPARRAARPAAS